MKVVAPLATHLLPKMMEDLATVEVSVDHKPTASI